MWTAGMQFFLAYYRSDAIFSDPSEVTAEAASANARVSKFETVFL